MTIEHRPDAPETAENHILREAWPEGVPPFERALLASLDAEKRTAVLARLDAVNRARAGESPEELAVHIGVGRASFFKMRRRWQAERTLAVLVPRAKRRGGRPKLEHDQVDGEDLDSGAARRGGTPSARLPSVPTVRRMLRDRRRAEAMKPELLLENFGSRFALDLTAIDIPISVYGEIEWAGGAFFLELQSGLILSAAVGTLAESDFLSRQAVESGCAFAEKKRLRVLPDPVLEAVVGDSSLSLHGYADYLRWLKEVAEPEHLFTAGNQRFGRFLLNAAGRRIGRVRLKPRTTVRTEKISPSDLQGRTPVSVSNAQILLDEEIRRHNEPIEEKLTELGLLSGGEDGALLRAFEPKRRASAP